MSDHVKRVPKIRRLLSVSVSCAALLLLMGCGGPASSLNSNSQGAEGDPLSGGIARIMQFSEPRTLDPAVMANAFPNNAILGNALFGSLLVNDSTSGEISMSLAESFETADGGSSFTIKLRPGLVFSDGTPLNSEAVKFNWDRIKDPLTVGAPINNVNVARMIEESTVADEQTLNVKLAQIDPNYGQAIVSTSLNWIASPAALQAGPEQFDRNPVGAGPFTLTEWVRGDVMKLSKNASFWDSPKPYLDGLELRASQDSSQRLNTLISGGVDIDLDANPQTTKRGMDAGLAVHQQELNGGQSLVLNCATGPLSDPRAREALAKAIDRDALNVAVFSGLGTTADSLFASESPFRTDQKFSEFDRAQAQEIFDQLADEGKPLKFTISSYPSTETRAISEAVQAQLSTYNNVDVDVKILDFTQAASITSTRDFEALTAGMTFLDPENLVWSHFHKDANSNYMGIKDDALSNALDDGRRSTDGEVRKNAYSIVQDRLSELNPMIFYGRQILSVLTSENVGGVKLYGNGSLRIEEVWMK
jgi:peptide/nickel transport system substrate-binding protein